MQRIACFLLMMVCLQAKDQMAEVSFYGANDKMVYQNLPFHLKTDKTHLGVKFGVTVFNIHLENCVPSIDDSVSEYFAAYVFLPKECHPEDIISELIAHGADFVFIDIREATKINQSIASNKYDVPVFLIDDKIGYDIFGIRGGETKKKFITILFLATESKEKSDSVRLTFFYEPAYEYSKKFLDVLNQVYQTLRDRAVFEPAIVTFASKSEEFIRSHCVSQGNYCALEPNLKNAATGKDVVLEGVRQKCIYKISVKDYFAYMTQFYANCVHEFSEKCSQGICKSLGISYDEVKKCFNESFSRTGSVQYDNENTLLREEKEKYKKMGVEHFPEIFINGVIYRGTLSYFDLLLSLCSALHEESKDCRNLSLEGEHEINLFSLIFVSISVFSIGVVVLAVLCRRIARKKYLTELNRSVDRYVTEYSRVKEETPRD